MISFQSLYLNLLENSFYRDSIASFPPGGNFVKKKHNGNNYWYYQRRDGKKVKTSYLGRADDEKVLSIINREKESLEIQKRCKESTRALIRSGFPSPTATMGNVLEALSNAGFFRLRGVLVGSLAYQCYPAMFGERLASYMETSDVDIAQFPQISMAIHDSIDESFSTVIDKAGRFLPDRTIEGQPYRWRDSQTGCLIDILAPIVGGFEEDTVLLESINTHALKLKFLDFLIYDEEPAVILYKHGITVNVPKPERYAIHKLIVAQERTSQKRAKDISQAVSLIKIMTKNHMTKELQEAFEEAMDRGHGWRKRLFPSLELLPDDLKLIFKRTSVQLKP